MSAVNCALETKHRTLLRYLMEDTTGRPFAGSRRPGAERRVLCFGVSGRDDRGFDGDRKTRGDRPAPEGLERSGRRRRDELVASRGSRAEASAEHGGEEGRHRAVAG